MPTNSGPIYRSDLLCIKIDDSSQVSVDDLVSQYNDVITCLLDVHAPNSEVTCRLRRRSDPWYDEECRTSKSQTRLFERRYKRWDSDYARGCWTQSLRTLHRLVENKRCQYWKAKIDSQPDPRALWKCIDNILCRGEEPISSATIITGNNFADFFENKVNDIRAVTEGAPPAEFVDAASTEQLSNFTPVSTDDVIKQVMDAPNKYSSLDPLPTWLLKSNIDLLAPHIACIFNNSMKFGVVPTQFKEAFIMPLLKKPMLDKDDVGNYRPVSNLSVLSKTLERIISSQAIAYLTAADLLPLHQSAYRKYHSTETALLKVCADLIEAMDQGNHALLGLLDLSAAFDTVDQDILIERLSRSYGIRSAALNWFCSYLNNRKQSVQFNGDVSTVRTLKFGVPQGSVLGPLLFILYTADLGKLMDSCGISSHFYADDSQLYTAGKPFASDDVRQRMKLGIEKIAMWMKSNRLRMNSSKTDFLWCATRRRCHQLSTEAMLIDDASLIPSSTVRDLGVILQPDMSMTSHVNQIVGRCFRQLRLIKSCVKSLTFQAARTAVNSFVISRVDYCNSLLAGIPKCLLDRLQSVLNASAKLLCGCRKYDHVTPLLRDRLHWLPVPQRIEFKLCLLTFKSLRGMAPRYIADLCLPMSAAESGYNLRSTAHGDLRVPKTCTKFGDRAFSVAGPRARNRLPVDIRACVSVDSFKRKLKQHLFYIAYGLN
jgi:Reverse transcriptase (RNA-dependent DNA polymerase)